LNNQTETKVEHHPQLMVSLSLGLTDYETKKTKWYANRSTRSELDHAVHTHFVNCPNCGGLIPDLQIIGKERTLRFTCTEVVEDGKTLAQTDYTKLLSHLLAHELSSTKHLTKKDLDLPLREFVRRLLKKEKEE
jgi:hypothetical protein